MDENHDGLRAAQRAWDVARAMNGASFVVASKLCDPGTLAELATLGSATAWGAIASNVFTAPETLRAISERCQFSNTQAAAFVASAVASHRRTPGDVRAAAFSRLSGMMRSPLTFLSRDQLKAGVAVGLFGPDRTTASSRVALARHGDGLVAPWTVDSRVKRWMARRDGKSARLLPPPLAGELLGRQDLSLDEIIGLAEVWSDASTARLNGWVRYHDVPCQVLVDLICAPSSPLLPRSRVDLTVEVASFRHPHANAVVAAALDALRWSYSDLYNLYCWGLNVEPFRPVIAKLAASLPPTGEPDDVLTYVAAPDSDVPMRQLLLRRAAPAMLATLPPARLEGVVALGPQWEGTLGDLLTVLN